MRIILQSIFAAACVALLAMGFQRGWWQAIAEMPPADRQVWLQGIWPVQDRLASEIGARPSRRRRRQPPAARGSANGYHRYCCLAICAIAAD